MNALPVDLFGGSSPCLQAPPKKSSTPQAQVWAQLNRDTASLVSDIEVMTQNFAALHHYVLQRTLEILRDPMTQHAVREDIITWIMEPPQPGRLIPFSFQACLWAHDPRCDLVATQEALLRINRQVLSQRQQLLSEPFLDHHRSTRMANP